MMNCPERVGTLIYSIALTGRMYVIDAYTQGVALGI